MTVLLDNVSVDTTSSIIKGIGGVVTLVITADDFGGGYLYIEYSRSGSGMWIIETLPTVTLPPPDFQVNYNKILSIELPIGIEMRVRLAGSAGASNVRVEVLQ